MEKILVDTDVIIDFLRGYNSRIKDFFEKIQKREIFGLISVISIVELYSGGDVEDENGLAVLEQLLSYFKTLPIEENHAKTAGTIRRKYKMGLADSLIAASCLENDIKLYTFNHKHFQKIKKLKLFIHISTISTPRVQ